MHGDICAQGQQQLAACVLGISQYERCAARDELAWQQHALIARARQFASKLQPWLLKLQALQVSVHVTTLKKLDPREVHIMRRHAQIGDTSLHADSCT